MTYEQCFQAMRGLGTTPALHMRHPGNWYVSMPGIEIGDGHLLRSVRGDGKTPEDAIEKTWTALLTLKDGERIVISAMSDSRREVRWNGFMWEDVPDPLIPAPSLPSQTPETKA